MQNGKTITYLPAGVGVLPEGLTTIMNFHPTLHHILPSWATAPNFLDLWVPSVGIGSVDERNALKTGVPLKILQRN